MAGSIVEPRAGNVFGFAWGSHVSAFLRERPDARLERDAGDVTTYSLTAEVGGNGVEARASFRFHLDLLSAVDLEPAGLVRDPLSLQALVDAVAGDLDEPFEPVDEGFEATVEGRTRIEVDRLDGRVHLEEAE